MRWRSRSSAPTGLAKGQPLTGIGCVTRVYTDLAVIDITRQGLRVVEMVDGLTLDELQKRTGAPLLHATK